jgi:hypothetical protein
MARARPGPWRPERRAQHEARYPPEEKPARNKAAQARYRERYADDRAQVRRVTNVLMRRSGFAVAELADAIRAVVGAEVARELGAALIRARRRRAQARR